MNFSKIKINFIALILLTAFGQSIYGQNLDSLKSVIPSLPDDTVKLRLLNVVFITISNKGNFEAALNYGNQALALGNELHDERQKAKTLHQFGLTYRNMGKFDLAMGKLFEALKIREKIGDQKPIAISYSTIATIFGSQKQYEKAEEYLNKSIQIFQELHDTINILLPQANLGSVYASQNRHQDAITLFKKVLIGYMIKKDTNNITAQNYNLGVAYKALKKYDSAMYFLNTAQILADKVQLKIVQSSVAAEISEIYLIRNEKVKAKEQIDKGIIIAEKIGDLPSLKEVYKHKMQLDSSNGDYKSALTSNIKYSEIKDSMMNEASAKSVERVGMKYEFDKTLRTQQEEAKSIVRTRNIWFILIGLCSIFSILLFINYRKKQKINKTLEIEITRNKISRDLHDELGSNLSSVSMQASVAKRKINRQEDVKEIVENISVASQEMVSKMSDIVWSLQSENENTTQLIERISNYCAATLPDNDIHFEIENKLNKKELNIQPSVLKELYLITKEAINNSLKHAQCKEIKLAFEQVENSFCIQVSDNGNGFDITKPTRTMGGYGLKNMNQRAEKIGALFTIESNINQGTKINLIIPI